MFDNVNSTLEQGNIGLGDAISYFTRNKMAVSIPLNDTQKYDLVVDMNGELKRVQVKTTIQKTKYKIPVVSLRTNGGNMSGRGKYYFLDKSKTDYVYILSDDNGRWLIPIEMVENMRSLNLGKKYDSYKCR